MADRFDNVKGNLGDPAYSALPVTPSDADDLTTTSRGIAFGVAGDLKLTFVSGETVTIPSGVLAAGVIHPLRVDRVWATDTTATDIVSFS